MKKISFILILVGLLVVFALPQSSLGEDLEIQTPETCRAHGRAVTDGSCSAEGTITIDDEPLCCVVSAIYRITDWIFFFLMAIVVIMVLFGAFNLLTAGGEPDKISKGRNYILWAAVGFIVALLAWAVPGVAKLVMGIE